jgi:hypothetical protein
MTLKGEARTKYMREYMRRQRAAQRAAKAEPGEPAPEPSKAALARAHKRIAELEAELARKPEPRHAAGPPLSSTAQERLDAAIRRRTKELEREFERKVQTEVQARMKVANESTTKSRNEAFRREQTYREFMAKAKKMGTLAEWNTLVLCLHPDSRGSASKAKLDSALHWVLTRKFVITGEK